MRSRCSPFLIALIVALLPAVSLADIHKCLVDGKIVYTDQECADNKSVPFQLPDINAAPSLKISYKGDTWLKDHSGYELASDASVTENTPVLIYGHTDWCGYCKKLDRTLLDNFTVQKTLSKFIKVSINPEHSTDDDKLFKSWGGTGYPTLFIQRPNQAPQKIPQPYVQKDGRWVMMSSAEFITQLQTYLAPFEATQPSAAPATPAAAP